MENDGPETTPPQHTHTFHKTNFVILTNMIKNWQGGVINKDLKSLY